jgi:hypothetical protein
MSNEVTVEKSWTNKLIGAMNMIMSIFEKGIDKVGEFFMTAGPDLASVDERLFGILDKAIAADERVTKSIGDAVFGEKDTKDSKSTLESA